MKLELLLLMVLASVAFTANAADTCMAKAQTQEDMNACAGSELVAADRELNTVYQQVMRMHAKDKNFIQKLRAAQRAWLVFRDAELAARYPDPNAMAAYGSVHVVCTAGLKSQLTRTRITQLRMWLDGIAEGDICTGSLPINGDPD
ncbi:MAG: DUF1311 domain-containing protein [Lysobacter sp.]|nr:DUF1311 domain-containing protein [Lysobacter sp.]